MSEGLSPCLWLEHCSAGLAMFCLNDLELSDYDDVSRYLTLMRSWYLLSSSHNCLNVELLFRLGLTTPPCWTEEKLQSVQPELAEVILHYW